MNRVLLLSGSPRIHGNTMQVLLECARVIEAAGLTAATVSLLTGAVVWFLWMAFVHRAESSVIGLSQLLFGTPALLGYSWNVIDPLVIALPMSVVALLVVLRFRQRAPSVQTG